MKKQKRTSTLITALWTLLFILTATLLAGSPGPDSNGRSFGNATSGIPGSIVSVATVQAASKATSKKAAALKAYNTFLQKKSYKVYIRYSVPFSKASFGLAYLNNDSVPELIVKDNVDRSYKDYRLIFTYKNGKVKLLNHDIFSKYYKKTSVYMRVIKLSTNRTGLREVQHNKLIGTQSKRYLIRQKGTVIYGEKINRYCDANMKDITPAEYNRRLKKLTKSKKASSVKYYKNSATNRRKYLK